LAFTELLLVKLLSNGYCHLVIAPRSIHPMAIIGDQKQALATSVVCAHTFTEQGRLLCLMVGAIVADSWSFLFGVVLSLLLSCIVNCLTRTFWLQCLLARCLSCPQLKMMICPTSVTALHNDAKFAMGWVRFASAWGIFLGRGLIHGRWTHGGGSFFANVPLQDNTVWCFNSLVLFTVLMCMAAELIEDFIVRAWQGYQPAPVWKVFSMQMISRFVKPENRDIHHPEHLFIPDIDGDLVEAACLGRRVLAPDAKVTKDARPHSFSKRGRCSASMPVFRASPNLRQARTFHTMHLSSIIGASLVLAITVLCEGLGNGAVFGQCPLSANVDVFSNLVAFRRSCPEY